MARSERPAQPRGIAGNRPQLDGERSKVHSRPCRPIKPGSPPEADHDSRHRRRPPRRLQERLQQPHASPVRRAIARQGASIVLGRVHSDHRERAMGGCHVGMVCFESGIHQDRGRRAGRNYPRGRKYVRSRSVYAVHMVSSDFCVRSRWREEAR